MMMQTNLSLVPTKGPGRWLKLYKLYRSAFPEYERKPLWMILDMRRRGKMDVWYCEQDGRFVGLAITLNGEDLILLDYFAIVPGQRGAGFGSAILRKLKEFYAGKGLFVEIESVYEDVDNLEERQRRKQFYLRNGMQQMNVMASVFGVNMELLCSDCQVDFAGYHAFYHDNFNAWAASHIVEAMHPEA